MKLKQFKRLKQIQKDHSFLIIYEEDKELIVCIYLNILLINIINFILHIFIFIFNF